MQARSADIEQRVLQVLGDTFLPIKSQEIAQRVGMQKSHDVNPVLYKLESDGLLWKTDQQPPAWALISNRGRQQGACRGRCRQFIN